MGRLRYQITGRTKTGKPVVRDTTTGVFASPAYYYAQFDEKGRFVSREKRDTVGTLGKKYGVRDRQGVKTLEKDYDKALEAKKRAQKQKLKEAREREKTGRSEYIMAFDLKEDVIQQSISEGRRLYFRLPGKTRYSEYSAIDAYELADVIIEAAELTQMELRRGRKEDAKGTLMVLVPVVMPLIEISDVTRVDLSDIIAEGVASSKENKARKSFYGYFWSLWQ